MSFRRGYGKPDKNQQPIFDLVERLPASVVNTTGVGRGFVDGVIGFQGMTVLVEVKDDAGELQQNQKDFQRDWRGGPILVAKRGDQLVQALINLDRDSPPIRRTAADLARRADARADVIAQCLEAAGGLIVDMHDLPGLIRKLKVDARQK